MTSTASRLYLWSRLQRQRFVRLLDAAFTGAWLGILGPKDLDDVDDAFYVGNAKMGPDDFEQPEYNRRGLHAWERAALGDWFPESGSLGVLAAGGGREVLALRHAGFDVDGWDCQPRLVELANRLLAEDGFPPTVAFAPRDTIPPSVGSYDGFILGWSVYTLVRGRSSRVRLLREVRRHLEPGAPLLLSFHVRTLPVSLRRVAQIANAIRRMSRRPLVEEGDYLDPAYVHLFTEAQLREELVAAGFEVLHYDWAPYGHAVARVDPNG